MTVPRIMLVAEPPAGPKVAEHLLDYADVDLVRPKRFTTVPAGTEWVLLMNGGPKVGHIHADAAKVGAHVVRIPPGWSAARTQLDKAGFFKALAEVNTGVRVAEKLTQRPFSVLAAPGVADGLLAEGVANKTFKVLSEVVAKVEEAAERAAEKATETVASIEQAQAAVAQPMPPSPRSGYALTPDDMAKGVEVRIANHADRRRKKEEILRLIFDRNPDATIDEAASALRTMSLDGRGMAWTAVSGVRRAVRLAKGLPAEPTPAPAPTPVTSPGEGWEPTVLTMPLIEPPAVPSPTPPPPAAPEPTPMPVTLPNPSTGLPVDVEAAARLLREALEQSGTVATFSLTFAVGGKAKIRWTPLVHENDAEV